MTRLVTACPHTSRPYRALGMCNACYLKQNGGSKNWYERNREKAIAGAKRWAVANPERRNKIALDWVLRDNKANPDKHALKERMRVALKGNAKSGRFVELLGCSIEELRAYLQSKFQDGMTWSNYGQFGWHIDHIKPCSYFDLSQPSQQRECFHYTNLQPLWWLDNIKKGATIV